MDKELPAKFRTTVREICGEFNDVSRVEITEIVDVVSNRHPELVEREKRRLLRESIGNVVRSLFHRDPSPQLILPMSLAGVDLPNRIGVRPKGKKSGPADWVLTDEATYEELDRKVRSLEPRKKPANEWVALKAIRDYLKPHMAEGLRDRPIGPVLAGLARQEVKASIPEAVA